MSPDASAPRPAPGAPEVDAEHPWLGLASFSEETRGYFYGREDEVAELARRVQRKLLTILFGQSGLGKTSILRAGIVPRLRPEGYCPVYVRIDYARESPPPAEQIKEAIFRATQATGAWTQAGVAASGESLWEFLHHRDDVLKDASGRTLIPLLIFDQFEEIFTLAQSDEFGRRRSAQFLDDLADLVENRAPKALEARIEDDEALSEKFDFARADYRILIALREDYLAPLEGLKGLMPSITQNRMRLARMTGAQALEAVRRPGGRLVSQEVAEAIVRFVAGGAEIPNAEVEPSLLSLICRELNNARIAQGRDEISAAVLAGSRETILSEFYERALAGEPPGVRQAIEDHLLTESGHRESIAEERLQKLLAAGGGTPATLSRLVDRRLLRIEERLDVRRVELTHDVLCSVVKASRDLRLEREARDDAERKLAAQRERERATRAALVRARKFAGVCAVLALVAVAGAVFGWISMKRAQEAEANADRTRLLAEAARSESEKLVAYLLEDFQLELAPVGRLDVVAGLAKRALDYYNGLPEALRTAETERNRALALVRYGAALRTQSRLDEGRKAIDEAVTVLARLRAEGDKSESAAIGLTLGRMTQARLASTVDQGERALAQSALAVDTIRPIATAPNASVAARRAYGDVLSMHGFLQMAMRQYDGSMASLEASRSAYRSIDDLALTDLSAAAGYAESTAWQVQTLVASGNGDDAPARTKEAVDVAARVLDKRPGHMMALRAQALATSPMSRQLIDDSRLDEALATVDLTRKAWREFVRLDPGNAISWSNLAVSYMIRGNALQAMGRFADAAANHREALDLDRQAPANNLLLTQTMMIHSGRLAVVEGARGRLKEADEAIATSASYAERAGASFPPDSFRRRHFALGTEFWRAQAYDNAGEYARALDAGRMYASKLEALEARDDSDRQDRAQWLVWCYDGILRAAVASGDFPTAVSAWSRVVDHRKIVPAVAMEERRNAALERSWTAVALARLGRLDEARAMIGPALAFHRGLVARRAGDPSLREEAALTTYAAAIAGAGDRAALLAEAASLVAVMPPEYARAATVTWLRGQIARESASGR
jgi:tetratricopeptide (TPR) repeat protein